MGAQQSPRCPTEQRQLESFHTTGRASSEKKRQLTRRGGFTFLPESITNTKTTILTGWIGKELRC